MNHEYRENYKTESLELQKNISYVSTALSFSFCCISLLIIFAVSRLEDLTSLERITEFHGKQFIGTCLQDLLSFSTKNYIIEGTIFDQSIHCSLLTRLFLLFLWEFFQRLFCRLDSKNIHCGFLASAFIFHQCLVPTKDPWKILSIFPS